MTTRSAEAYCLISAIIMIQLQIVNIIILCLPSSGSPKWAGARGCAGVPGGAGPGPVCCGVPWGLHLQHLQGLPHLGERLLCSPSVLRPRCGCECCVGTGSVCVFVCVWTGLMSWCIACSLYVCGCGFVAVWEYCIEAGIICVGVWEGDMWCVAVLSVFT